jgi:hypothetical protein
MIVPKQRGNDDLLAFLGNFDPRGHNISLMLVIWSVRGASVPTFHLPELCDGPLRARAVCVGFAAQSANTLSIVSREFQICSNFKLSRLSVVRSRTC